MVFVYVCTDYKCFFKQKTAYEMRISDWSSDVCSSDLTAAEPRAALTCLPTIEACLTAATPILTRREAQVCARVLFGMTSMGIALALGVGEESAMTDRKSTRLNSSH